MSHMRFNWLGISLLLVFAFTQDRDRIIFPHAFHIEEAELECSACHEGIEHSGSLAESFLPTMDTCSDCHDIESDCEMCHTNTDEPDTYALSGFTSGRDFSHSLHLPRFSDCSTCHASTLNRETDEYRTAYNSMNCSHCHWQNAPGSHDLSWQKEHGYDVSLPAQSNCSMCHTEKFCDDCHRLSRFTENAHPSAYMLQHGFDARMDLAECTVCHEVTNDCQKCHRQQMVMPMDHNSINWTSNTFSQGGLHASAVEDSPEICAVCHTVQTCEKAGCHAGGME